ncbi:1-phosphofructokinase [Roseospira marina]|uniref:Phosphofructokinase n=1 Tax=Roseospira marina TaxID=140057 RepID=A0A5M6IDE0_9PROT|nr:1-phosphofructokinase [Roseospira marina]KAA5606263.1 1-phosphofructokinase [Roseospira marina]MBB4314419.1 1-phosphofructokinase [Roseospira marina]MBB5087579.1 1-phosphofructokinase [Roseospira marina]
MATAPRIITLSLNSAIDQTITVPGFALDSVNRVVATQTDAGGKGVNVACFLAHVGHAVALAGLLGRDTSALFTRHFAATGVTDITVHVHGATRTNLKIIDPDGGSITDLNFPGPGVSTADVDAVLRSMERAASGGLDWLVLSGSLPAGLPSSIYAELTTWGQKQGARVVLDTSGAPLADALAARPDIIKPNQDELEALVGSPMSDQDAVAAAAGRLVADGIGLVVVSRGPEGAILRDRHSAWLAVPPDVPVASTVGAGDAMVAGLVHAAIRGLPLNETARQATGFALGALGEIGPRLPDPDRIEALARQVTVTPLDVG